MAKITIAGDSIVVTSSKTLEDIKNLEKYRPSALRLYEKDEDGHRYEAFSVATVNGTGSIGSFGAVFGSCTHDEQKLATITMPIPVGTVDAVKYAADMIGSAITKLNRVEAQFDEAMTEVAAEKQAVLDCITVI